tara:strand:- start:302 stop:520 length:219 start_codon:yes stop_codon:yes gene_type:complete
MDEQLKKDVINILMKGNRPDLVALMMTIFEDLDDSDYEEEEVKEPMEEYYEGDVDFENGAYRVTEDGFFYLK